MSKHNKPSLVIGSTVAAATIIGGGMMVGPNLVSAHNLEQNNADRKVDNFYNRFKVAEDLQRGQDDPFDKTVFYEAKKGDNPTKIGRKLGPTSTAKVLKIAGYVENQAGGAKNVHEGDLYALPVDRLDLPNVEFRDDHKRDIDLPKGWLSEEGTIQFQLLPETTLYVVPEAKR